MKHLFSILCAVVLFLTFVYGGMVTTDSIEADDRPTAESSEDWHLYYTY
jgi:hypothetical protein